MPNPTSFSEYGPETDAWTDVVFSSDGGFGWASWPGTVWKVVRSLLFGSIGFTAALTLSFPARAADQIGTNVVVRNQVALVPAGQRAPVTAKLHAPVGLGDQVRTAKQSMVQIRLLDRTNFTVGANAQVTLDRFVYNPNKSASAVGARVARGAFRFMSGRSIKGMPGKTEIVTPAASIGVRGTIFDGVVGSDAIQLAKSEPAAAAAGGDSASASLIVLRGSPPDRGQPGGAIDVTAGGRVVAVERAGDAVYIPRAGAPPIGPFRLSPAGSSELQILIDIPIALTATSPALFESQMLTAHNLERAAAGAPPVAWDPDLADHARLYAAELAQTGRLMHSSREGRRTERENIAVGQGSAAPLSALVGDWTREKSNFTPGLFPNVTTTGNWSDVGHYTQMIWSRTTSIGCAFVRGKFDALVCRYAPPGNTDGKPVL